MAWWRLEWMKLKRKRTEKLVRRKRHMVAFKNSLNNPAVHNDCMCVQAHVYRDMSHHEFCNISQQFSAQGILASRYYLGTMKIAASELEHPCTELTGKDRASSAVTVAGRFFSPAVWGATKVHVKSSQDDETLGSHATHNELIVLQELRHPGILLLMGVTYRNTLQLVFEHISIGSLYHSLHVQQVEFTVQDIFCIMIKLCDAVRFMHQHSWLHLGLSSHAVQLTSQGQAKLSSFELSKKKTQDCRMSVEDVHVQQSIINWQAPEQCLGEQVGPETDVYSLSLVLQEMITGKVPWGQSKTKHVRRTHVSGVPLKSYGKLLSFETHALLKQGLVVHRSERTLGLDEIEDLCTRHLEAPVEKNIVEIIECMKVKKGHDKLLSFQFFKKHLSSCQTCAFSPPSPDPLRRLETYCKTFKRSAADEALQIPEEIYFDDHFDANSKLGTHLQLLPQ